MGAIAAEALPLVRNVIEAVVYAIFPFVLLLMMLAQGRGLGLIIKSFVFALVWIQLWPPLYAILNYVATLASAQNLTAAAALPGGLQGLALDSAASIYNGAISDQAVAGYLVISIPIIATAIVKGGEVAFQAVSGVASIQSAAQSEGGKLGSSSMSQGNAALDQYAVNAQYGQPAMQTRVDERGNAHTALAGSGVEAVKFLENQAYFGAQLASARTRGLEQAAGSAAERARSDSQSAANETVAALGDTVSKSRDRIAAQDLGTTVSEQQGASLAETHNRVKSEAGQLQRKYELGENDAAAVALGARVGLGPEVVVARLDAEGKLGQEYRASLQRAYEEVRGHTSSEETRRAREYASQLGSNEQFRYAVLSHQSDAAQASANFSRARKAAEQAQASFAQRDSLAEQARVARTDSASSSYDWIKDPANRDDVVALETRLRGVADAGEKQRVVEDYFAEKAAMTRPTRYLSGATVRWSDGELRQVFEDDKSTNPALRAPGRAEHERNIRSIGGVSTAPVQDTGVGARVAAERTAAEAEVSETRKRLAKGQVAAQQRFEQQTGLEHQDRDGDFGSPRSTSARALGNAAADSKRSAENFVDGVFGIVDRVLNGDKGDKK